jgi:hypothetical protein
MAFTYDITTPRGKVRAMATDTDPDNFTFNDDEIDAFMSLAPANLFSAAALVVETWARTQSRLSGTLRSSDGTTSVKRSIADLLSLAKSLRNSALTDSGLVIGSIDVSSPGELLDSFRPEWRGINDLPVVE